MKQLLLLITCSAFGASIFAQSTFKQNDIYIEAGGNGLFASVNYERQLTRQPGLGVRIGIGFYSENTFYLTMPFGINYLLKLKSDQSFIEAGLGATWTRIDGNPFGESRNFNGDHFVNFIPSVGFRRHTTRALMWRISLTPVINKYGFVPWLGLSIGKRF